MIVDDSSIVRRSLQRLLNTGTFEEVFEAKNGVEALEKFKDKKPEIVTMDITMPEMDGLECVDAIMNISPETKILVISALADKSTAIQAVKNGAKGFLCKPFTPEELDESFGELLD